MLHTLGARHAMIVPGEGGLDEITLSGNTAVWELVDGEVRTWTLAASDTGLPERSIAEIRGGSREENAATMRRLFQGETGPIRDIVLVNSAAVLLVGELVDSIREGISVAKEVIDNGEAQVKLQALAELSQRLDGNN